MTTEKNKTVVTPKIKTGTENIMITRVGDKNVDDLVHVRALLTHQEFTTKETGGIAITARRTDITMARILEATGITVEESFTVVRDDVLVGSSPDETSGPLVSVTSK
mmetsp:Transcript_16090/g.32693  ORF Transcript_16090/g.32693 Transcript_16090/m.32693 type:complete len:107 (+) Transcript_16090:1-321(+)